MECEVCGKPIEKKRPDSKYYSATCINKAKRMQAKERELDELDDIEINNPEILQIASNASAELRTIEREHFETISNLKTKYRDMISDLKELNLQQEFSIEKLNDKISDLRDKRTKEIDKITTQTTKDTLTAITQMPAFQND